MINCNNEKCPNPISHSLCEFHYQEIYGENGALYRLGKLEEQDKENIWLNGRLQKRIIDLESICNETLAWFKGESQYTGLELKSKIFKTLHPNKI